VLHPCPLTFSLRAEGECWRWTLTGADGALHDTGACPSHKVAAAHIIRAICQAQLASALAPRLAA
jgi:hypothetical protein